jgi:hypothetical protein
MYTSWPAIWQYRPFDQCWSGSVRANWRGLYGITDRSWSVRANEHSRGVHLRFLKNRTSWTRNLKFLTVCMVPLHICQPCVLEGRSSLLDHPTLPFLVCPFLQSVACFLFIVDAHLLTGCMALQTARLVMIAVCTSQLAFRRCSPSILKKQNLPNPSSWISRCLFDFYLVKVSSYGGMAKSFFCFRNYGTNLCCDSRAHGFGIPGEIFF